MVGGCVLGTRYCSSVQYYNYRMLTQEQEKGRLAKTRVRAGMPGGWHVISFNYKRVSCRHTTTGVPATIQANRS